MFSLCADGEIQQVLLITLVLIMLILGLFFGRVKCLYLSKQPTIDYDVVKSASAEKEALDVNSY